MTPRPLAAALLGAALLLASPARAASELRLAAQRLLGGIEESVDPAALRRLGPQVDRVLVEIAADPAAPPLHRLRATLGLGYVPSALGRAHLTSRLRALSAPSAATDGMNALELAACAESLGGFGPGAARDLAPLLAHASDDVRMGAARGLARTREGDATRLLRARLAVERDAGVRLILEQALGQALAPAERK